MGHRDRGHMDVRVTNNSKLATASWDGNIKF